MDFTEDQVADFQKWLQGGLKDESYLLSRMSGDRRCVVYGCGSPQLLTLAICATIDAADKEGMINTLRDWPPIWVKLTVQKFIDGPHKSKTVFTQASNFWLKDMAKYSMQTTKAITGSTEGTAGIREKAKQKKISSDKEKAIRSIRDIIHSNDEPGRGAFYDRFGKSPFKLDDIVGEGPDRFPRMGAKGREQTTHQGVMKLSDLVFDAAIRRSCKFLIYDSIQNGLQIVYLLDDLDLSKIAYLVKRSEAIPEEARLRTGSSEGKVPICTTEIRELFRNWDYLKNHVSFYMGFNACETPWSGRFGQEESWAEYAAHRAQKILAGKLKSEGDGVNLNACIKEAASGQFAKAIQSYHLGNPSLYNKGAALHVVTKEPETL